MRKGGAVAFLILIFALLLTAHSNDDTDQVKDLDNLDVNKDGKISRREFGEKKAAAFACLDTDHDGNIDFAEKNRVRKMFRASKLSRLTHSALVEWLLNNECVAKDLSQYAAQFRQKSWSGENLWKLAVTLEKTGLAELGVTDEEREAISEAVCREIEGHGCLSPNAHAHSPPPLSPATQPAGNLSWFDWLTSWPGYLWANSTGVATFVTFVTICYSSVQSIFIFRRSKNKAPVPPIVQFKEPTPSVQFRDQSALPIAGRPTRSLSYSSVSVSDSDSDEISQLDDQHKRPLSRYNSWGRGPELEAAEAAASAAAAAIALANGGAPLNVAAPNGGPQNGLLSGGSTPHSQGSGDGERTCMMSGCVAKQAAKQAAKSGLKKLLGRKKKVKRCENCGGWFCEKHFKSFNHNCDK